MCYVGIQYSANEYIWNIKYFNCGEIDQDMIDHHSWPEFFFRLYLQLHNCFKGQCHEDFAVLGQFWAKIVTLRLYS